MAGRRVSQTGVGAARIIGVCDHSCSWRFLLAVNSSESFRACAEESSRLVQTSSSILALGAVAVVELNLTVPPTVSGQVAVANVPSTNRNGTFSIVKTGRLAA